MSSPSNAIKSSSANSTNSTAAAAAAKVPKNASSVLEPPSSFKEQIKEMFQKNKYLIIFIGAALVIFIIVIVYIYFAMRKTGLTGKTLTTVPIKLFGTNSPRSIMNTNIPVPSLGMEYTYSFWVYLENYDQTATNSRMLWYRGTMNDIATANPIIYMDKSSNIMYLCVKSQNSVLSGGSVNYNQDVGQIALNNQFLNQIPMSNNTNQYLIMKIDYVPLQKWVNVAMVIDNQIISIYLDGDIYSVKTVNDFNYNSSLPYSLIVDKTDGDIYIGANPHPSQNITINGYLSKLDFFSYAISSEDIKRNYDKGPFSKNFLSMIGLGSAYGVRSPVYKIGNTTDQS